MTAKVCLTNDRMRFEVELASVVLLQDRSSQQLAASVLIASPLF